MSGLGSSTPQHTCKISMLWNWNTIDSCFLARSWHIRTRGHFAGSCIGVFFLVMAHQWLIRVEKEYNIAILKNRSTMQFKDTEYDSKSSGFSNTLGTISQDPMSAFIFVTSHRWLLLSFKNMTRLNATEHLISTLLFTVNWGVSYIIMLLFMYYNGYIIISCILGALFGRLIFANNASVKDVEENTGCCC